MKQAGNVNRKTGRHIIFGKSSEIFCFLSDSFIHFGESPFFSVAFFGKAAIDGNDKRRIRFRISAYPTINTTGTGTPRSYMDKVIEKVSAYGPSYCVDLHNLVQPAIRQFAILTVWLTDWVYTSRVCWRREWDSNPRRVAASLVFKTSSLNHSDISP